MSVRYHRGGTYQTRNPKAVHSPLRSMPLYRHPAAVFGTAWYDGTWNQPKPAVVVIPPTPAPPPLTLAEAEAGLREAVRLYDHARHEIGLANARRRPALIIHGRIAAPAVEFTAERIKREKSYAFSRFNVVRGRLVRARKAAVAARAAAGV